MLNTGDLAQAEKNVTINKPIEKICELLMEKCKTGGYRDDCIPDMGIYVFAILKVLAGTSAKMIVQINKIDDNSTSVNIKGTGLSGSITTVANLEGYIIDTIKYLNGPDVKKPAPVQPKPTTSEGAQPKKSSGGTFWIVLLILVVVGVASYFVMKTKGII